MSTRARILVVDDEAFNVDYLEQELEELDYDTIAAVNGVDALTKMQTEQPDLVLLDIMMPIMDGFAVLRQAKADPLLRDVPIIVISAMNDLDSVVKGIIGETDAALQRVREVEQPLFRVVHADVDHLGVEDVAQRVPNRIVDALHVGLGGERGLHAVDDRHLGVTGLEQGLQPLDRWRTCSFRRSDPLGDHARLGGRRSGRARARGCVGSGPAVRHRRPLLGGS